MVVGPPISGECVISQWGNRRFWPVKITNAAYIYRQDHRSLIGACFLADCLFIGTSWAIFRGSDFAGEIVVSKPGAIFAGLFLRYRCGGESFPGLNIYHFSSVSSL